MYVIDVKNPLKHQFHTSGGLKHEVMQQKGLVCFKDTHCLSQQVQASFQSVEMTDTAGDYNLPSGMDITLLTNCIECEKIKFLTFSSNNKAEFMISVWFQ